MVYIKLFRNFCCIFLLNIVSYSHAFAQFDLSPNVIYVSPAPGSYLNHCLTNILVRFDHPFDPLLMANKNPFAVYTDENNIDFDMKVLDDKMTVLLQPLNALPVNVKINVTLKDSLLLEDEIFARPFGFYFYATKDIEGRFVNTENVTVTGQEAFKTSTVDMSIDSNIKQTIGKQIPIKVLANNHTSTGYYFISTISYNPNVPNRCMILDHNGKIIYDRTAPYYTLDFKKLTDNTFCFYNWEDSSYHILDSAFSEIDTIRAGNGYITDNHELQIDKKTGHYVLLAQEYVTINMADSVTNGNSSAKVLGLIIQELDEHKNVVFEWKTLDHLPVTASVGQNLTAANIDYAHCNSVDIESDTTLLLSSRHLNEIERIDRRTGELIWRFGLHSKNNDFNFADDTLGFTYQHDARRLPNGHITLYDDGNLRAGNTLFSRAVEYELDEETKTAHMVWEYRNTPDYYASFMGNVQRLPNGGTLIGWGGTNTVFTELDSNNQKVLEVSMPQAYSYRAFRFDIGDIIRSNQVQLAFSDTTNFCNVDSSQIINNIGNYLLPPVLPLNSYNELDRSGDTAFVYTETNNNFFSSGKSLLRFSYSKLLQKDTIICEGSMLQLNVSETCNNLKYKWSTSDTVSSINISPTSSNAYWVEMTNGNYVRRDTVNITVSSVADFEIYGNREFSVPYEVAIYSVPYSASYHYLWSLDKGNIVSGNNTNVLAVQFDNIDSSVISVIIMNQNGCSKSSTTHVVYQTVAQGIDEVNGLSDYKIYPNPTTGSLNISTKVDYSYQLFDMTGRLLKRSGQVSMRPHSQINIDDLNPGFYMLYLISDEKIERIKVEKL